jgi:hypothetical protein
MDTARGHAPLFPAPPALRLPDDSFHWWLTEEPWGVLTWIPGPRGRFTADCVRLLMNDGWPLAMARRPPGQLMTIVHDWRNVMAYESEARSLMVDAARLQRDDIGRVYMLLGESVPPLVMMGIELATLALRPIGTDIRVLRTPEELRAELPRLRVAPLEERPMAAAR